MNISETLTHALLETASSEIIVLVCLFILVASSFIGLVANTLILYCIKKQKSLQTFVNAALVNSCAVNVLACVILIPMRIIVLGLFVNSSGIRRRICKAETFMRSLCEIFQLAMLVAISFERYNAVIYPFDKNNRLKRVIWTTILSWCFAIIYAVLSTTFLVDGTVFVFCYSDHTSLDIQWTYYDIYVNFPFGVLSFVFVICFYICIMKALMEQSKKMINHSKTRNRKVHPTMEINIPTPSTIVLNMTPSHAITNGSNATKPQNDKTEQENNIRLSPNPRKDTDLVEKRQELNVLRPTSGLGKLPKIGSSNTLKLNSVLARDDNIIKVAKINGNPLTTFAQKPVPTLSENVQKDVSISKPCTNFYEVHEADGTVRLEESNNESMSGAVCMFNPKNREIGKRKLEAKIAKTFAIGIGIFGFVWIPTPIFVMFLYYENMLSEGQFNTLTTLSTLSSTVYAINPLLTIFTNQKIKTECVKVVKKLNVFNKN